MQGWDPPGKDVKVHDCIQRETKMLMGLEVMSWEEHLRALGLSGSEEAEGQPHCSVTAS